ncbi:MAG: bifunctional nicotinamidase/pyrazinamidase [Treponema sp.]|nr:bifunctional nicotinamidase/pyrazinamidase [Treponema sp.]
MKIDMPESALLEIDIQNDFCPAYTFASGEKWPGGALAVSRGDEVIAPLNALAEFFAQRGGRVIASQDWHPQRHVSFAQSHPGKKSGETIDLEGIKDQMLWPNHCVAGSEGARFHEKLNLRPVNLIIRKGFRRHLDSYSAFFENDRTTPTGLDGFLKGLAVRTVVIGGLASDYCVLYTAIDSVDLGYRTIVIEDAVRGVGYPEGSIGKAFAQMKEAGILIMQSGDIE